MLLRFEVCQPERPDKSRRGCCCEHVTRQLCYSDSRGGCCFRLSSDTTVPHFLPASIGVLCVRLLMEDFWLVIQLFLWRVKQCNLEVWIIFPTEEEAEIFPLWAIVAANTGTCLSLQPSSSAAPGAPRFMIYTTCAAVGSSAPGGSRLSQLHHRRKMSNTVSHRLFGVFRPPHPPPLQKCEI